MGNNSDADDGYGDRGGQGNGIRRPYYLAATSEGANTDHMVGLEKLVKEGYERFWQKNQLYGDVENRTAMPREKPETCISFQFQNNEGIQQ